PTVDTRTDGLAVGWKVGIDAGDAGRGVIPEFTVAFRLVKRGGTQGGQTNGPIKGGEFLEKGEIVMDTGMDNRPFQFGPAFRVTADKFKLHPLPEKFINAQQSRENGFNILAVMRSAEIANTEKGDFLSFF